MRYVIKNQKNIIHAYQLGCGSDMELMLIEQGRIVKQNAGVYELFSQEAVHKSGELAYAGDYFKVDQVDGKYYPYPNQRDWFERNHIRLSEDEYEQKQEPIPIWEAGDPLCEEISFLLDNNKLTIKEQDEMHYFNACLWGTWLSAKKDAALLFYSVSRDPSGEICDIDFNFVKRTEFERSYSYLSEQGVLT